MLKILSVPAAGEVDTVDVNAYIDGVATRLATDGCETRTEDWTNVPVLVGYRSDFRLWWFATKLHLFTIVMPMPYVTAGALETLTNNAINYALARKGEMRGFQSGVAVFPAAVSTHIDPAATAWAEQKQQLRFACMARPVTVDVSRGVVGAFRGTSAMGLVYSGHLRRKLALYFPPLASPPPDSVARPPA